MISQGSLSQLLLRTFQWTITVFSYITLATRTYKKNPLIRISQIGLFRGALASLVEMAELHAQLLRVSCFLCVGILETLETEREVVIPLSTQEQMCLDTTSPYRGGQN